MTSHSDDILSGMAESRAKEQRNDANLRSRNTNNTTAAFSRHQQYNSAISGSRSFDLSEDMPDLSESRSNRTDEERRKIRRRLKHKHRSNIPGHLKWTQFMHSATKNHIVAVIGEFIGTFLFLFFAFAGTQVANIGSGDTANNSTTGAATGFNPATLLYISLCFGFSLMVNAWIFFRISGGLFNPAVTLALALIGAISPLRAVLLFVTQVSGACFSAYIVSVLFPTPFNVQTTLAAGTSLAQGVFIEAICTCELVFTIIMLAKEKHKSTFIAPVGIGLALFIGELVAVYYTGGSLNPARSFGPAAVTHDFNANHWIYWGGPLIGALLAVAFYKLFKVMEYEMVNPGQDGDIENDPTQNPDHEIRQIVEERQAEVEEIQAIEEEGGFGRLIDGTSVDPSILDADGVVSPSSNQVSVQRRRSGRQDLEAQ